MDDFMIAFLLLLGSTFLARTINEKANKNLNQDQKAALIDLFSNSRIYTFGLLIGIVVLYFISLRFNLADPVILSSFYIIAMALFILTTSILSYKKLKTNGFPDTYTKSYISSTIIRFVGMVIFFILVWR